MWGWIAAGAAWTAVGATAYRWWRREARPGPRALIYHRLVSDDAYEALRGTERHFCISISQFRAHLDALEAMGVDVISPDEALDARREEPAIVFTFDDGCESVYQLAYPALEEKGWSAMVFMTVEPDSWVFHLDSNPQRRMTAAELRELVGAGWSIGAHGLDHAPPAAMESAELEHDFTESRRRLELETGAEVDHYAVPGNFVGRGVERAAEATGFRAVWTARPGRVEAGGSRLRLPRYGVEGTMSAEDLVAVLTPMGTLERRAVYELKRLPARLLGPKRWLPLRAAIFRSPVARWLTVGHLSRLVWVGAAVVFATTAFATVVVLVL